MGLVSLCFSRRDTSNDMHFDLVGSTRDLDLRTKFDLDRSKSTCFDSSQREKHNGAIADALIFIGLFPPQKNDYFDSC